MLQKLRQIDEAKIAAESRVYRMAENTAKYGWEARPVYIIHKGRYYSGGKMKTLLSPILVDAESGIVLTP